MILFVCRGNASRSQIAEAILKNLRKDLEVESAGIEPAERISEKVKIVLREIGIEWNGKPKALTKEMIERADLIVAMCEGDFPEDKTIYWIIPDPKGKDLNFYRMVRDEIYRRIEELLNILNSNRSSP